MCGLASGPRGVVADHCMTVSGDQGPGGPANGGPWTPRGPPPHCPLPIFSARGRPDTVTNRLGPALMAAIKRSGETARQASASLRPFPIPIASFSSFRRLCRDQGLIGSVSKVGLFQNRQKYRSSANHSSVPAGNLAARKLRFMIKFMRSTRF